MIEAQTAVITPLSILFEGADPVAEVARSLQESGVTQRVVSALGVSSSLTRDAAVARLGEVSATLLNEDVSKILISGWQKHQALRDAAHRTLGQPGSEEIVGLASHRIRSTADPSVDVYIDENKVQTVGFTIELSVELRSVNAVISAGRLVGIASGQGEMDASMSCEGIVVKKTTRSFDLHLMISLGQGIALL
jgi:hypothetical protein